MDGYESLYMYYVEGVDSIGDPVRALVTAGDTSHARAKVKQDYQGTIKNLRIERITGHQWDEYLKGYGTKYGPVEPFREDYSYEMNKYAIAEGRPVFL